MKDIAYQLIRQQTQREFAFWVAVFATAPGGRTRAQRRHIATRQKRGRLLALEVVAKGRNPMALVPRPAQLFKQETNERDTPIDQWDEPTPDHIFMKDPEDGTPIHVFEDDGGLVKEHLDDFLEREGIDLADPRLDEEPTA